MIVSSFEIIFKDQLYKIVQGKGLASLLEML